MSFRFSIQRDQIPLSKHQSFPFCSFPWSLATANPLLFVTKFRVLELCVRLKVTTILSLRSLLKSCSRSCELFSSLCFLQFGESLGTASNKQQDLLMNSGKLRTTRHVWLRETRFQWCLSFTVWYKEKEENNKLKKLLRQAIIGGLPLSVCLPSLGILKLILAVNLILMIFDNFVNSNICHGRQNISYKANNYSYHLNFFWKENKLDGEDATYYPHRYQHCCNTSGSPDIANGAKQREAYRLQ